MNVLLVDDNQKMLELLSSVIDWEREGCHIVGLAADGAKALEIAQSTKVHILITDIKMPVMDGIQLISQFRKVHPHAKIMVLSAYDEFGMVREAFKLGATEYILKTEFDPQRLIKILEVFKSEIMEFRGITTESSLVKAPTVEGIKSDSDAELYRNLRVIKNSLLNQLIRGYISEDELLERDLSFFQIGFVPGFVQVAVFNIDNYKSLLLKGWKNQGDLLAFAVLNAMDELLFEFGTGDAFHLGEEEFAVIFSYDQEANIPANASYREFFQGFINVLHKYLGLQVSAGMSFMSYRNNDLQKRYKEAQEACQLRFVRGLGQMYFSDEVEDEKRTVGIHAKERLESLKKALYSQNTEYLTQCIETLKVQEVHINLREYGDVVRLYEKYYFIIYEYLEENGLLEKCERQMEAFEKNHHDIWPIHELNQWLESIIRLIGKNMNSYNQVVKSLIVYVMENYAQNITLQSAADHIGINKSYLSRLINKELGMGFSDYLNNLRVEKAKELMKKRELMLYEIAERVGYCSFEHFSRVFKKIAGVTPREYN